eukprot:1140190-Pelagomonas_calceolata.AAC.4
MPSSPWAWQSEPWLGTSSGLVQTFLFVIVPILTHIGLTLGLAARAMAWHAFWHLAEMHVDWKYNLRSAMQAQH